MEDQVHLVLGDDPVQQVGVEDRPLELAGDQLAQRRLERVHVQRDDGAAAVLGQAADQAVADFATGASDEDDGLSHGTTSLCDETDRLE